MISAAYSSAATPQTPSAMATSRSDGHGAVITAAINRTAQKWTMVGVPNARFVSAVPRFSSATSVITMNCRPVNVAAAVPVMT